MAKVQYLYRVSGRVQGVFFRESTRKIAVPMGFDGWAVNLPDGTVEVVVSGSADGIDALEAFLSRGPKWAHVTEVNKQSYQGEVEPGFATGSRPAK